MIYLGSIKHFKFDSKYDEVFLIVRSIGTLQRSHDAILTRGLQMVALSPSQELFNRYLAWRANGYWNIVTFEEAYRPIFEEEIKNSINAQLTLQSLVEKSREGKRIALLCFCESYLTCHRKIIGELLENLGAEVKYA